MNTPFPHQLANDSSQTVLGGIALTRLSVYEGLTPDGQPGGSPHMHLACAEAYVVLAGVGAVELLSIADGYRRIELHPGVALEFESGVVHRLINGGGLEILVLMQNAGLPELGDAVFTFPSEDLQDAATYARRATIESLSDALARRDRAVEGFMLLKQGFADSPEAGTKLLRDFQRAAAAIAAPASQRWRDAVEHGPAAAVAQTRQRLDDIASGRQVELDMAKIVELVGATERIGMCGLLHPLLAEGESRP